LAARRWVCDKASSGFSGSSMMIMSHPARSARRRPRSGGGSPVPSSRTPAPPAARARDASGRSA
jgi:hypothetical protein